MNGARFVCHGDDELDCVRARCVAAGDGDRTRRSSKRIALHIGLLHCTRHWRLWGPGLLSRGLDPVETQTSLFLGLFPDAKCSLRLRSCSWPPAPPRRGPLAQARRHWHTRLHPQGSHWFNTGTHCAPSCLHSPSAHLALCGDSRRRRQHGLGRAHVHNDQARRRAARSGRRDHQALRAARLQAAGAQALPGACPLPILVTALCQP